MWWRRGGEFQENVDMSETCWICCLPLSTASVMSLLSRGSSWSSESVCLLRRSDTTQFLFICDLVALNNILTLNIHHTTSAFVSFLSVYSQFVQNNPNITDVFNILCAKTHLTMGWCTGTDANTITSATMCIKLYFCHGLCACRMSLV